MFASLEDFRKSAAEEVDLEKFEYAPDFEDCLDQAIVLIKESLQQGRERHGDSFTEAKLLGFVNHIQRKGRDQYRAVAGNIDIGTTLSDCAMDGATFSVLEIAYLVMQEKRRSEILHKIETT